MISIPSSLVEFILLGPLDDRRQLQDSPILGDVWVEFGRTPTERVDLLVSPWRGQHAGAVAGALVGDDEDDEDGKPRVATAADIAYLQGLIVARLTFKEILTVVVPKTKWWIKRWNDFDDARNERKATTGQTPRHDIQDYDQPRVTKLLKTIIQSAKKWRSDKETSILHDFSVLDRFIALTGFILWAGEHKTKTQSRQRKDQDQQIDYILATAKPEAMARILHKLPPIMLQEFVPKPLIWQVSRNRVAIPAITKSVPAVKADAATTLFKIDCSEIAWAVLDSGIHGSHPALQGQSGSRVLQSFDFRNYRKIVSLTNLKASGRDNNLAELKKDKTWDSLLNEEFKNDEAKAKEALEQLAKDARKGAPIHWDLVQKFVEIKPDTKPSSEHGTHVAGIIGANKKACQDATQTTSSDFADGMCPDISLYDFRVLGSNIKNTEFAIIAALQFIRYLNSRDNFLMIHGANLSLSIPHDVRNFACGRTPICDECEKLIENGVVVVAAAGNHGYKSFETKDGSFEGYTAFSITDPGNADGVITVGATHRFWPHTYGVSFFSSRGPTGDGRLKPDLVAPGERIRAPVLDGEWGDLDGTSMAAPHVSGAAAMLMARYSELVGQPRVIKKLLCESATDLGRERSFQGHGMLDVLRAFQAI